MSVWSGKKALISLIVAVASCIIGPLTQKSSPGLSMICFLALIVSAIFFVLNFFGLLLNVGENQYKDDHSIERVEDYTKHSKSEDYTQYVTEEQYNYIKMFDALFRKLAKLLSFSVRVPDRIEEIRSLLDSLQELSMNDGCLVPETDGFTDTDELEKIIQEEENYKRNDIADEAKLEKASKALEGIKLKRALEKVKNEGGGSAFLDLRIACDHKNPYLRTYLEEREFIAFLLSVKPDLENNGYDYTRLQNTDEIYDDQLMLIIQLDEDCFGTHDKTEEGLRRMFMGNHNTKYYKVQVESEKAAREAETERRRKEEEARNAEARAWYNTPPTGDYFMPGSDNQCMQEFTVCASCVHKYERLNGHRCRRYGGQTWSD